MAGLAAEIFNDTITGNLTGPAVNTKHLGPKLVAGLAVNRSPDWGGCDLKLQHSPDGVLWLPYRVILTLTGTGLRILNPSRQADPSYELIRLDVRNYVSGTMDLVLWAGGFPQA